MIVKNIKKMFTVVPSFVLATASSQLLYGYQTPNDAAGANSGIPTETGPNSANELQSLVAPIALYPDALSCGPMFEGRSSWMQLTGWSAMRVSTSRS
jgi:hypothetical protein